MHSSDNKPATILSVTQLNRLARMLLEDHFPAVMVEGEISNLAVPSSGHWYLTLKDDNAQVRCAMFRNRNMFVRMRPRNGMKVMVKGKLGIYEGRGDYQLVLEQMEETGAGALRLAYEVLKQKLQSEGLFSSEYKKPLPAHPRHLAVITSPTGAAIADVLSVLKRRFPALLVTVIPVSVQGEQSAGEILAALQLVNRKQGDLADVDVVLLTRGGGSLEDLWSFNDEALAREIFASPLPIVAAIGHEVDFTIAEFVADIRAPTPSAAAELISPNQEEYRLRLHQLRNRQIQQILWQLQESRTAIERLQRRLQHPGRRLTEHAQRLDELELRLRRSIQSRLQSERRNLQLTTTRLQSCSPGILFPRYRQHITSISLRLQRSIQTLIQHQRMRLKEQSHALNNISPLATLSRGYSITTDAKGKVLSNFDQIDTGATITTRLANGFILSKVESSCSEDN